MGAEGFRFSRTELFGIAFGLLGFLIHVRDRNTRTVGGVETVLYEYDYAALGFGAVAVLFAMRAIMALQSQVARPRGSRGLHLLLAGVIALLGLYHVASGVGVLRLG